MSVVRQFEDGKASQRTGGPGRFRCGGAIGRRLRNRTALWTHGLRPTPKLAVDSNLWQSRSISRVLMKSSGERILWKSASDLDEFFISIKDKMFAESVIVI